MFEGLLKVGDEVGGGFRFDDHIVYVSLDIAAYLFVEAHLYGPLICSLGVLQAERHSSIAVCAKRSYEGGLSLIVLFQGDLVIAGVAAEEGEEFATCGGVDDLVYTR
jgi:hypothetical protein